jgi:mono/diheme cytochrome c family protein
MTTKISMVMAGALAMTVAGGALVARSEAAPKQAAKSTGAKVERGKYLVNFGGCHDCHTPMKMGANGPERDMSRALSGHPESLVMPPAPKLPPGPWIASVGATMTAWAGPWGTSFTANLTPDKETGLGAWTLQNFVATMRTGRHMGQGRQILPPMPYEQVASLTDDDLGAVFAYLQSIPAIKNRVPQPLPPPPTTAAK